MILGDPGGPSTITVPSIRGRGRQSGGCRPGVTCPSVKDKNVSRHSLGGRVTPVKLLPWPDMSAGVPCCPHVPHHVELAAGRGGGGQNTEQVQVRRPAPSTAACALTER